MARTVAIDILHPALRNNTTRFKVLGNAVKLPLQDKSCSFATMFFLNRYIANQLALMSEVGRMLEDDGKFVTLDYSVYQMSPVEISAFDPIRLVLGLRKMSFGNFNIKKLLPEIDSYSYGKDFYQGPLFWFQGRKLGK